MKHKELLYTTRCSWCGAKYEIFEGMEKSDKGFCSDECVYDASEAFIEDKIKNMREYDDKENSSCTG